MFVLCIAEWLFECTVQKLVLVITCLETNEVLERWQFDIECDKSAKESRSAGLLLNDEDFSMALFFKSQSIQIPAGGSHEPSARATNALSV